eukprot:13851580-Alexandrium_andersonii.AAC.1
MVLSNDGFSGSKLGPPPRPSCRHRRAHTRNSKAHSLNLAILVLLTMPIRGLRCWAIAKLAKRPTTARQ